MEFYGDLSDRGLPSKQKSHKLQLETKSNVAIFQKICLIKIMLLKQFFEETRPLISLGMKFY